MSRTYRKQVRAAQPRTSRKIVLAQGRDKRAERALADGMLAEYLLSQHKLVNLEVTRGH